MNDTVKQDPLAHERYAWKRQPKPAKKCEHTSCSYAPNGMYKCNNCGALLTQGDIEAMEGGE